jgi:hypothetical protein
MPTPEDQPTLLAKIRDLAVRIRDYQRRFDLPKGHSDRLSNHGSAVQLQKLKTERDSKRRQLEPFKLIATGISCRDCHHFGDADGPACFFQWNSKREVDGWTTKKCRTDDTLCGPFARWFAPRVMSVA